MKYFHFEHARFACWHRFALPRLIGNSQGNFLIFRKKKKKAGRCAQP